MQSRSKRTDVVIAGAGPAGLATTLMLGRAGWNVRVFDRRRLPADKPCGEGIMPPGVAILKSLGVAARIDPAGKHLFEGIRYLTPSGTTAESAFAEGPGWGVRRTHLSRALLAAASELPNVQISDGRPIDRFEVTEDGVEVESAGEKLTCRLLVGADGLHSRVRKRAGLAATPAKRRRFGIRRHYRIEPWCQFVEVHSGRGIEAYITPCGPEQVGVAFLQEKSDSTFDGATAAERFDGLFEAFPRLQDRLSKAAPAGEPMATGPLEQRTRDCIADGVALIGDAAGYLDACTGEGITLALKQAVALEACLAPCLSQNSRLIRKTDLAAFHREARRITRPYKVGTRLLMQVANRPRLMEKFVSALRRHPEMLRHFLSFNMGEGRAWPGLRRALRFGLDLIRA